MAWISIDWVSAVVLAYLLGSIPVAYLASRLLQGKDIRNRETETQERETPTVPSDPKRVSRSQRPTSQKEQPRSLSQGF